MNNEKEDQRLAGGFRQRERIDIQIHRRRKVKALSPLESEWESSRDGSPSCGDEQSERDDRAPDAGS